MTKKIIGRTRLALKTGTRTIGRNNSARDPHARLKDMDASGIDQVMIFPSTFVYLPLVENAEAALYLRAGIQRLGLRLLQRRQEAPVSRRGAAYPERRFCHRRVAPGRQARLQIGVSPADHRPGQVSDFSGIRSALARVRGARHGAGHAYLSHRAARRCRRNSTSAWAPTASGYFPTKKSWFIRRGSSSPTSCRSWAPNRPATRPIGFMAEAMTWTGVVLMTGWLEKFPRLKVAILESNSSWLPLVLEKAETYLDLYKHIRREDRRPA